MKTFFLAAGIACFLGAVLAEEPTQKQKSMTPTMISFTDLKWVELRQVKGTQFAALSGDPKPEPLHRCAKYLQAPITGCILTAARSRW